MAVANCNSVILPSALPTHWFYALPDAISLKPGLCSCSACPFPSSLRTSRAIISLDGHAFSSTSFRAVSTPATGTR